MATHLQESDLNIESKKIRSLTDYENEASPLSFDINSDSLCGHLAENELHH
jgi:hypothetical protein